MLKGIYNIPFFLPKIQLKKNLNNIFKIRVYILKKYYILKQMPKVIV